MATWTPTSILHIQAVEEEASPSTSHTVDATESESCILFIVEISRYSNIYRLSAVRRMQVDLPYIPFAFWLSIFQLCIGPLERPFTSLRFVHNLHKATA